MSDNKIGYGGKVVYAQRDVSSTDFKVGTELTIPWHGRGTKVKVRITHLDKDKKRVSVTALGDDGKLLTDDDDTQEMSISGLETEANKARKSKTESVLSRIEKGHK